MPWTVDLFLHKKCVRGVDFWVADSNNYVRRTRLAIIVGVQHRITTNHIIATVNWTPPTHFEPSI